MQERYTSLASLSLISPSNLFLSASFNLSIVAAKSLTPPIFFPALGEKENLGEDADVDADFESAFNPLKISGRFIGVSILSLFSLVVVVKLEVAFGAGDCGGL
ncbi:hypothetical protein EYC80_009124 [Monilinia laxa]|uniref:Uncharacterized protein n=1 Tax=Monilinia laxa TaxID=61186 RepID=A0A5N6K2K9_MONLA|nr:hypothetical protein EYC80_009124 [Monilinia laxa]